MSAILSIREVELKPGTDVEEFEKFVRDEASKFVWAKGISLRFVKHGSGKKRCPYLLIYEVSEEHQNLPEEANKKRHEILDERKRMSQKISDKLAEYIVDWANNEGVVTIYFPMD